MDPQKALVTFKKIPVINDVADRDIKLIEDYISSISKIILTIRY